MPLFAIIWPWIGIGAAGSLLLVLFNTDGLQENRSVSCWFDLSWLVWLGLAACLLHQFEEHGLDLVGRPYAFRGALCALLGHPDPIACPVPLSFITAANVGTVWGAGLLSVLLVRRRPAIGLSFFAIPLVKACVDISAALAEGGYTPGLFTACALLLPLSIWAMSVAVSRAGLPRRALLFVMAAGVAVQGIETASLLAYLNGYVGGWPLAAMQILNALVPAAIMSVGPRRPAPPPRRKPNLRVA